MKGIVGTILSGKSALVHRYLTGSYLQDESPEGGRFKKEVIIDGQSYLLLIRDEGGPPEMQFSCWVDAVVFVFSVDNEPSFNAINNYYSRLCHLRSNTDIPILLVGTQDTINENSQRVIDENRARKLAQELKNCQYFETCATYGLNVNKVFQTACHHIIQQKNFENISTNSRSSTPNQTSTTPIVSRNWSTTVNNSYCSSSSSPPLTPLNNISNVKFLNNLNITRASNQSSPVKEIIGITNKNTSSATTNVLSNLIMKKPAILSEKPKLSSKTDNNNSSEANCNDKPLITKSSTISVDPMMIPKRNQSINQSLKHSNEFTKPTLMESFHEPIVSTIPGNSSIAPATSTTISSSQNANKDCSSIAQTPNSSRKNRRKSNLFTPLTNKNKNDEKYKNGEIGVGRTIPIKQGYLYKKSKKTLNKDWKKKYVTLTTDGCLTYHPTLHDYMDDVHGKNISLKHTTVKIPGQKPRCGRSTTASPNNNSILGIGEDSDGNEFIIVSLDNKQWHFNANNNEEREEWISAIEQQILSSLQNSEYDKSKIHNINSVDDSTILSIRTVPGNKYCVDCNAPNPDWASLNLGALICIECSGIHRNLGSHISKVRSLGLDVWPSSHVSVMLGLGNKIANEIWEHNLNGRIKPTPTSKHDEKEKFIRLKYEKKEFLAPLEDQTTSIDQQLIDCVHRMDIKSMVLLLAHSCIKNINLSQVQSRDKKTLLHIAASRGCLEIVQLLAWNNTNEKAIDKEGKTALFYAKIAGHKEIEELLNNQNQSSNNNPSLLLLNDDQTKTIKSESAPIPSLKKSENIPLNFKNIEIFDKLPASII
ncbi:Putative Arf-GAP with GTPase, ANK repeat and PH domain-containing protein 7 [Sarcoptes scabiei]|uniref:Putative Arf-GAP with GTPase, ANK repeat and PH domain-containing protein 7 n=1 Tax=Sarcoptes scabiei TaxID=52283 RepID=A0A834R860_SARSC|nr:Putative Arf-GAP with GTPase, ANK repeat and PH domain-containing protein 7 [Sarcoptes scabiei]